MSWSWLDCDPEGFGVGWIVHPSAALAGAALKIIAAVANAATALLNVNALCFVLCCMLSSGVRQCRTAQYRDNLLNGSGLF
jgi:hypothetical protein